MNYPENIWAYWEEYILPTYTADENIGVFLRKDMHLGTDNTGPAFQKSIFLPKKYLKRE